jgi:DHA1 family multidrug resistance protein-like MFS transporter
VFTGTITANLTLVVSNTPEKRIGLAVGIMNSAVFAGDTLAPLFGGLCADRFGYRLSFAISALSLLASFLITLLFVREEFQRSPASISGFTAGLPALRRPPAGLLAGVQPGLRAGLRPGVRAAVAPFLPVIGLIALGGFARYLATPQYPLLVQEIAVPSLGLATQTGLVNAAAGAAVVLAGILIGRLADRGGLARLGAACAASAGVFTAALAAARSLWALVPLRVAADFSSGGADPILNILLARRVSPERRGLAFGLAGSVRSAAWALGGLLGGVLSAYVGFWAVFVLGGALFLTAAWLTTRFARAATSPR